MHRLVSRLFVLVLLFGQLASAVSATPVASSSGAVALSGRGFRAAPAILADFNSPSITATHRLLLPYIAKDAPPPLPYRLVAGAETCAPNAGVTYFNGVVRDRAGNPQNAVCVHVSFFGPRNTKCSGCDGVGDGNWGFSPFGGPAQPGIPVEIFVVRCPAVVPPGGQSEGFEDLTPLSEKWTFTTPSESQQCTGITFREN